MQDVTGKNAWGAVIYDEECFATKEVFCVGQALHIHYIYIYNVNIY